MLNPPPPISEGHGKSWSSLQCPFICYHAAPSLTALPISLKAPYLCHWPCFSFSWISYYLMAVYVSWKQWIKERLLFSCSITTKQQTVAYSLLLAIGGWPNWYSNYPWLYWLTQLQAELLLIHLNNATTVRFSPMCLKIWWENLIDFLTVYGNNLTINGQH